MKFNKILNIENIIFLFATMLLGFLLYSEYYIKKQMFYDEKLSDLKVLYKDKLESNKQLVKAYLINIINNNTVKKILDESSNNINKDKNRDKLYKKYKTVFKDMKQFGIIQFQFHLKNGDSFLRLHNPKKYGDSLLFRESIKKVISKKEKVYGYEIGKYFDGFRYIFPIILDKKYIGSVELSFKVQKVLEQLNSSKDGRYTLCIQKNQYDNFLDKAYLKNNHHQFIADKSYLMANTNSGDKHLAKSALVKIIDKINDNLKTNKAFIEHSNDKKGNTKIFIFLPIKDINSKTVGYILSITDDEIINKIQIMQFIKFLFGLFLFALILYFYKQNKQKNLRVLQLENAINKTTLVSKTDPKGKITYVNEAFCKLSGYEENELIGKSHNIVRDSDVPKSVFKEMWQTIKSGEIWHGTFPNIAKNGSKYVVDASIVPIKDINNQITEYIAIRHDVTELESYKNILKTQLEDKDKSIIEQTNYVQEYEDAINYSTSIAKLDLDMKIKYVNESYLKLTNYRLEEMKDRSILDFVDEQSLNNIEDIITTISNGEIYQGIFKGKPKSGKPYYTKTIVKPIRNIKGDITEYLLIKNDITDLISLHQEIEDTQKEIIYKMGEIGETRSKETGNHVKRVAEYSKLLATLYGLDENEAELLRQASPMHDIGKVGIPDSVLKKPGKLDKDEWDIMQSHAQLGYDMLKHSTRPILKAASIVAGQHHEKWDGTGYPCNISGEDIHIYGRITAIADVFDALGSDRCYKQAWEIERILELFKEQKGKHFDPKLVELFLENLEQFLSIRDKFKD